MFGWRVEEEAKIRFIITAVDRGACRSAEHVGLQLADAKRILGRLQEIVVSEQLQRHCEPGRPCPGCLRRRQLKDHRRRRPRGARFNRIASRHTDTGTDATAQNAGMKFCPTTVIRISIIPPVATCPVSVPPMRLSIISKSIL